MPVAPVKGPTASFQLEVKRAVSPGKAELERNPRARSAKLRSAVRTGAPAIPYDAIKAGVLPEVRA
jgi:16S rRNA (cytosine1402-N4)-methyltransferase